MGCHSGPQIWRDRSLVSATNGRSQRNTGLLMVRFFYNPLYPIGLLFFLPGQITKLVRRGNYRHKLGQRFGSYDATVRARLAAQQCTWIHAVSVGEVAVALKLAGKIHPLRPKFFCGLTTNTTNGVKIANTVPEESTER